MYHMTDSLAVYANGLHCLLGGGGTIIIRRLLNAHMPSLQQRVYKQVK